MKQKSKEPSRKEKLLDAIPVRLETEIAEKLTEVAKATGVNRSALMRVAVKYCLPKFLSGEINILACGK